MIFRLGLTAGFWALALAVMAQTMPDIGPTRIPFYTGNLSVDSFMHYWRTNPNEPVPQVTPESIAQLKRTSCFAVCDYLSWPLVEPEPGRWDFSLFQEHARLLKEAGIKYNVFCWLHFPPKWYLSDPNFVPYRCLEHGETVAQMSLWSPATRKIYRDFYAHLAKALGDDIAFIRLAMPSEYGEIGYPVGMTNWLVPQPHVHQGYWCGDPEAAKSYRAFAMKRYRSLAKLNAAWGTDFKEEGEIGFPPVSLEGAAQCREPSQVAPRAWRLDFIDWYDQSWTDFMVWSSKAVRKSFPGYAQVQSGDDLRTRKEIIASLGYGAEVPAYGNDESRHVAAMKKAGLAAQTPGDIGYFATRRVSSACALYGVPYYTEPPGDVTRDREVQRIWMDASNGSQVFFDYPQNLDAARDLFAEYKDHLTGRRSETSFGLLLSTTTLSLHPDWGWPPTLLTFSERVRNRLDYEVLDERMIEDGGLDKLGIRTLAMADVEYLPSKTLRKLTEWVRGGGVLIDLQAHPVRDLKGSDAAWRSIAPSLSDGSWIKVDETRDGRRLWSECGRKVGAGRVLILPGAPETLPWRANLVAEMIQSLAALLPGAKSAPRIDPEIEGAFASLFADRILYYNSTDHAVSREMTLREEDFGKAKPEKLAFHLEIAPHSIVSVPLK